MAISHTEQLGSRKVEVCACGILTNTPWHSRCHQGLFHGETADQGTGAPMWMSTLLGPGMVCTLGRGRALSQRSWKDQAARLVWKQCLQAVRLFPFELGICLRSLVSFKVTLFLGSSPCSLVYLPSRKQVDRPCSGLGCWEAGAGRMEWGQSCAGSEGRGEGGGPSLMPSLRASHWQKVPAAVMGLLESVLCPCCPLGPMNHPDISVSLWVQLSGDGLSCPRARTPPRLSRRAATGHM